MLCLFFGLQTFDILRLSSPQETCDIIQSSVKIGAFPDLCFLASMWNIRLSIRCCDICKDLRLEIPAIYCRNQKIGPGCDIVLCYHRKFGPLILGRYCRYQRLDILTWNTWPLSIKLVRYWNKGCYLKLIAYG